MPRNQPKLDSNLLNTFDEYVKSVPSTYCEWDEESNISYDVNSEVGESLRKDPIMKVSDAQVFGPRFCQLFNEYSKTLPTTVDPTRHLMALCLDNLIPFCIWARESEERTLWIRDLLLNHDYLRSEVRNGIVMVLIYTFASIKAAVKEGADMFSTLHNHENGLGIANKFSLRIYNDPYYYLYFLKSSISGLIDAGVIPDNERQNQPKKSKVKYEIKEEVGAFKQISSLLTNALDKGNNSLARGLVTHISLFWQQNGKFARNRKFMAALNSLRATPSIQTPSMMGPNGNVPPPASSSSMPPSLTPSSTLSSSLSSSSLSSSVILKKNESLDTGGVFAVPSAVKPSQQQQPQSTIQSSNMNTDSNFDDIRRSEGSLKSLSRVDSDSNLESQSIDDEDDDNISQSSSTSSCFPFEMDPSLQLSSYSANLGGFQRVLSRNSPDSLEYVRPFAGTQHLLSEICRPIQGFRFEKINPYSWKIKEYNVFDLDSFLTSVKNDFHISNVLFIDENALFNSSNYQSSQYCCPKQPNVSLEEEMQRIGSFLSSWTKRDLPQLREMIFRWQVTSSSTESLLTFWKQNGIKHARKRPLSSIQPPSPTESGHISTSLSTNLNGVASCGILIFEYVTKCGILLRKCPKLGVMDDLWCLAFYSRIQETFSTSDSLFSFLVSYFPQLKHNQYLNLADSSNMVCVKYFPHEEPAHEVSSLSPTSSSTSLATSTSAMSVSTGSSFLRPPDLIDSRLYRFIGTLHSPLTAPLELLEENPYFLDFQLFHDL